MEVNRLDPNLPLFTAAELAAVSGLSRGIVDLWGNRGLLPPTRRERMPRSAKGRPRKGHGRPMFSVAAIFRARLAHDLGAHLRIGLSEWIELADIIQASEVAVRGWMEAVAHAIETNTPAKQLYVYAAYIDGNWMLNGTWTAAGQVGAEVKLEDSKGTALEKLGASRFGAAVPYIVIPMSEIFAAVYRECKKLLKE